MKRTLTVLLLVAFAPLAEASTAASFTPALIGEHDNALPSILKLPQSLPEGSHYIRCELKVTARGRSRDSFCYRITATTSAELVAPVRKAARKARFVPAQDAGDPIAVNMQLTVIVDVVGNSATVSAFPNDGVNIAEYGWDYVSPQRLANGSERSGQINTTQSRPAGSSARYVSTLNDWMWWRARIGAAGELVDLEISGSQNMNVARRAQAYNVTSHVEALDWRPGFVNGQATEMDYLESYRQYTVAIEGDGYSGAAFGEFEGPVSHCPSGH